MSDIQKDELLRVGKRLLELRKTLSEDTGTDWTQPRVAKEISLSQNKIARLEKGLGSIDNLIKILIFFHEKGYNLSWIFAPDNTNISKYQTLSEQTATNSELIQTVVRLQQIVLGKS